MLSKKELFNAKSSSQKIEKGLQIDVVNVGSYADTDKDGNNVTVSVLVDKNGKLTGLVTIKDIEKSVKYPNTARDKDGRLLCAAAIGVTDDVLVRAKALVDAIGCTESHVSVSVEDFTPQEWQEQYRIEVSENPALIKKPDYDPKDLLK